MTVGRFASSLAKFVTFVWFVDSSRPTMTAKKPATAAALEKIKAVRELTLRGVGGEKENARRIYRRKLAEHGLTEEGFEETHRAAAPETPPEEPLPANLRTVYVSGEIMVNLVAGHISRIVRDRTCGVTLRNDTLSIVGTGTITVTLTSPFRTLYASGTGAVNVTGFVFKDVAFHHSGSGTLTVAGEAAHATLAPSGNVVVSATAFDVQSLKIAASGKAVVRATCRTVCMTVKDRAAVQVTATRSAAVTVESGAKVTVSGCPVAGRRPVSGLGKVRFS